MKDYLRKIMSNPLYSLYKNSVFLIFSSLTASGAGFFFWLIAANFYEDSQVGLAAGIVSAMTLLSVLSLLGFDIAFARYIPEKENKEELINSGLTTSLLLSLILAVIFVAGINLWTPGLAVIWEDTALLVTFLVFAVVAPLLRLQQEGVFVGFRKTEYTFIQSIVILTRISIVPFMVSMGALGIYASYGLMLVIAFLVGVFLIARVYPGYRLRPKLSKSVLSDIYHFSRGNYFARIFEELPTTVLPLMVLNVLGENFNAYFFVAWQIAMLVCRIPRWVSLSMLVEGSYDAREVKTNLKRVAKFISILLALAIVLSFFFGDELLGIFGVEYSRNAYKVLIILVFGSIPFSINAVYAALKRIRKEVAPVLYVYGGIAAITIIAGYLFVRNLGIIDGIGYSWLIANIAVAIVIGLTLLYKKKKLNHVN